MAVALSKKDAAAIEKRRVERRYDLLSLLIGRGTKWAFFSILAWQGRVAVQALAGKTTLTNIALALGAQASIAITVSWSVTAAFGIWVFFERRLRKGTIERLTLRTSELELQLDRARSSSKLTPRGDTRPEDQR